MTAESDFKAFLWRHPEIQGMSRTERLIGEIRDGIEAIGKRFISDGEHVTARTMDCLQRTVQDALQQMVWERKIHNFDIHQPVHPMHPNNVLEVVIQPVRTVERIVVDLVINP